MNELEIEQMLQIQTSGQRDWYGPTEYNRYEATPYAALDRLFQEYTFGLNDSVIDYGCGKGRVSFYIHHHFQIPVKGVEVNLLTFSEAMDNLVTYGRHQHVPIEFDLAPAEKYEIGETDNRFYFFNPFSVQIFKKVVNRILDSVKAHRRQVDIILYYPMPDYTHFMKKNTPFQLVKEIKVPDTNDRLDRFLIYRYE